MSALGTHPLGWTDGEDAVLALWRARGLNYATIARRLHSTIMAHRTVWAIRRRLGRM